MRRRCAVWRSSRRSKWPKSGTSRSATTAASLPRCSEPPPSRSLGCLVLLWPTPRGGQSEMAVRRSQWIGRRTGAFSYAVSWLFRKAALRCAKREACTVQRKAGSNCWGFGSMWLLASIFARKGSKRTNGDTVRMCGSLEVRMVENSSIASRQNPARDCRATEFVLVPRPRSALPSLSS